MIIDLPQLSAYQDDLTRAEAALGVAKRNAEYARLQIKQTKQAAAAAKKNPLIKAFITAYGKDKVEVMPSPGLSWVSVHVRPNQSEYRFDPTELGIEFREVKARTRSIPASPCLCIAVPASGRYTTITDTTNAKDDHAHVSLSR